MIARRLRRLFFATLPIFAFCPVATAATVQRTLRFVSGVDTACSRNCLYVSINGSEYEQLGCNKAELGGCHSTGGLSGSLTVNVDLERCNLIRFKVVTQGQDGGVPHVSVDSARDALIAGGGYLVNSRTENRIDLWLNDNIDQDDRDFHDLRAVIVAPEGTAIGLEGIDGADCSF